jgi:carbamoyl-phosphate synthase large subunit
VNFAGEAMCRMLGCGTETIANVLELDYVGVKVPMFSFGRLHGADPLLGVEMASTGEVGCLGSDMYEALLLGLIATGFRAPRRGVLLSLGPKAEKFAFADEVLVIRDELRLPIFATIGTASMLHEMNVACDVVGKTEADGDSAVRAIESGLVDLVINVPVTYDEEGRPDGFRIRRAAIDHGVPLITDPQLARTVIEALRRTRNRAFVPQPLDHFMRTRRGVARAAAHRI